MEFACSQIRHTWKGTLKKERGDFAQKISQGIVIEPPILSKSNQSTLGFNHPFTARLLVPIKDLAKFISDPRYMICFLTLTVPCSC
jgi:hypothetical protein